MKKFEFLKAVVSITIPLSVGAVAGAATAAAIPEWYMQLNKPFFNPPNWVFGPVWTVLYLLMGISLFLIWRLPYSADRNHSLRIFAVQLLFNFAWSYLFFYFKMPGLALIEIILLWLLILWMIRTFYRLKPLAGWLNIPYILWVSFATLLNAAYWWLN